MQGKATIRRSPLHSRHEDLGASLEEGEGWELPVEYASAADEHLAVRHEAGVFDLCHLGELAIKWSWAGEYLQTRLTNDVEALQAGQCQYTLLTDEDGGVVDDLILFRLPQGFLLTVNAGNLSRDLELLSEMTDVSDDWGLLSVQGPASGELLGLELDPFAFTREEVLGVECLASRTGYTGEPGYELLCNSEDVGTLWDNVLELGVVPCGMAARESLRLEQGLVRHGCDVTAENNPYEAGLGNVVKTSKNFVGVGPLRKVKRRAPSQRLVSFVMEDETVPAAGASIAGDGRVTSAAYSPILERGIGMAYVWPGMVAAGAKLEIDVDGATRVGHIHEAPLLAAQPVQRRRGRVQRLKAPRPPRRRPPRP